jgi:hypothetical protein
MALTGRQRAVLDLERTWWQQPGSKATTIRSTLGLSPTRYYQVLAALVEDPDAVAYDPLVVRRVRSARDRRRGARFERPEASGRTGR